MLILSRFFHKVTNFLRMKEKLCRHYIGLSFNCFINTKMNIIFWTKIGRKIRRFCVIATDMFHHPVCWLCCFLLKWTESLFLTPAPELIGNSHSDYALEIWKHFASSCKSTVGAILPFPNMDKLGHGFSAGKQVVASCLHCINCTLNSNLTTNPIPLPLCVSYYL